MLFFFRLEANIEELLGVLRLMTKEEGEYSFEEKAVVKSVKG